METREIKIKIHDESDLFSSFDPDQKLLSDELTYYLAHNYLNKHRSVKEHYVIRIISDVPVNQETVRQRIQEYYSHEKDNSKLLVKKLTLKEFILGILGIILLMLWLILSEDTPSVFLEILCILGWVTTWEAANIAIIERSDLVSASKSFDSAISADFVFECEQKQIRPD